MALAAIALSDTPHRLVNVLTASGPGGFGAFTAGDLLAHWGSSFR